MYRYAQLDTNNIVIGISDLSGKVNRSDMILLSENENISFGWRLINDKWTEPEAIESGSITTPYQPTNAEIIQSIEDLKVDLLISGVIDNV